MKNGDIKISVIIPVFNLEKYIKRCLISVMHQTLKEIEIIVIDDGSNDQSQGIIKELSNVDNRIKYFKQSNSGVSSARNKGIEIARGSYITFVDGDDYIESRMLEEMYIFAEHNNLDISICLFSSFPQNNSNPHIIEPCRFIQMIIEGSVQRSACGAIYSSELLARGQLKFDIDMVYGEDMLFIIKAISQTKKNIGVLPYSFYIVVQRAGSAIRTMNLNQYRCVGLLHQRLDEYFETISQKEKFEASLNKYYLSDVFMSLSHISMSQTNLLNKLSRISELKSSEHVGVLFNQKQWYLTSKITKIKIILIKYMSPIVILLIYLLNFKIRRN